MVDVEAVRLGGRPAAGPAAGARRSCTRRTCAGFTADPSSGVAPGPARDVRRASSTRSRTSWTSGSRRSSCCPVFAVRSRWRRPAGLVNYWGYQPVVVLRATRGVQPARPSPTGAVDEFRDLVKALHRAGHRGHPRRRLQPHRGGRRRTARPSATAGSPTTTTTCSTAPTARATRTTAACGNTFNANGPIVRRLILDSLRYWVEEMHVDGFRFDLAVGPVARRGRRRRMAEPARHLGHRDRPGPGRARS